MHKYQFLKGKFIFPNKQETLWLDKKRAIGLLKVATLYKFDYIILSLY